jgi:hypothetical protein
VYARNSAREARSLPQTHLAKTGTVDAFQSIDWLNLSAEPISTRGNYYEQDPTFNRKLCDVVVFSVDGMLRVQAHDYGNGPAIDRRGNTGAGDGGSKSARNQQQYNHYYD